MSELARADERAEMIGKITDPMVVTYLEEARHSIDARQEVVEYLRSQFDALKDNELVPPSATPGEPIPDRGVVMLRASNKWNDLANDICIVAERLWRDDFLGDKTNRVARERLRGGRGRQEGQNPARAELGELELLCQNSYRLLQLWLETSLYKIRALSNFQSWGAVLSDRSEDTVERKFATVVHGYLSALRQWGHDLRQATGLQLFSVERRDAELLKALGKEFGRAQDKETGWKPLASDARSALRFQSFNTRRLERRLSRHYLRAGAYFVYWLTTGYGARPRRFAATGLITIGAFTLAFFANDFFNPGIGSSQHYCAAASMSGVPWYDILWHYLYLSVATLTSLGPDSSLAEYCGGTVTQILLVAAALFGYFLLATLAALLVNQLTDAD